VLEGNNMAKSKSKTSVFVTINGKKFPTVFRNVEGKVVKAPKGKFVTQFGTVKPLPKKKPAAKKKK